MRKSTLILYFKHGHKILETIHLINSITNEDENNTITVFTFEDNRKYFNYFPENIKIETIDSTFLQKINQNPLFSTSFALTQYWKVVTKMKSYDWDKIISYNDNSLETLIATFINESKSSSMYLSRNGIIKYNSQWGILNNLFLRTKNNSIHPIELAHLISGTKFHNNDKKIEDQKEEEVFVDNQISQLRNSLNEYHGLKDIKLIGISLVDAKNYFELKDIESVVESILESSEKFHPVLISTGEETEEIFAEETRRLFHEKVTILTVDKSSEISLLKNIDLLISLDNHQLQLASLINCPLIEINFNQKDTLIGPINCNAYKYNIFESFNPRIISQIAEYEILKKTDIKFENGVIKSYFDPETGYQNIFSNNIEKDQIKKNIIHLSLNPQHKLKNNNIRDIKIKASIFNEVKKASSSILNALRIQKSGINNAQKFNTFISAISSLWENAHEYEFIQPTLIHFQGRVENIDANKSPKELISSLESELFNLKDNLKNIQLKLTTSEEELPSVKTQSL